MQATDLVRDANRRVFRQRVLSRGTRAPSIQQPILMRQPARRIPADAAEFFRVPTDVGVYNVYFQVAAMLDEAAPIAPGSVRALFLGRADRILSGVAADQGQFIPVPVPMVPGTHRIRVFNHSGTDVFAQCLWGIEG